MLGRERVINSPYMKNKERFLGEQFQILEGSDRNLEGFLT